MPDATPTVTILVPVLNEAENVLPLYRALEPVLTGLSGQYRFEILFTDNHSQDSTFSVLQSLAGQDPRVRVLRFTRNFGFQRSILTGYLNARGDAVIQIDCDLQDPPDMIRDFLAKWEQGYHVVYGVRRSRKEAWPMRKARALFYFLVDVLSEYPLPRQAGDFRLVSRSVVEVIRKMDDAYPYLRGTIAGLGFNQAGIPYDREQRSRGRSNFNLKGLFALAVDGILATSVIPLRIASFTGVAVSLVTLLGILVYLIGAFFHRHDWPSGFATITVLVLFGISLNALFLGVIGEYIGRIHNQLKRRPLSIVEYSIENGVAHNHARTAERGQTAAN